MSFRASSRAVAPQPVSKPATPPLRNSSFRARSRFIGVHPSAFSLIEITLALGIVAFALLAVFGLLPVAIDSSRESAKDATFAAITKRVVSDVRSRGYDWLTDSASTPAKSAIWPYVFDNDGLPLDSGNATLAVNNARRAFVCDVVQGTSANPSSLAVTTAAPVGTGSDVPRIEFQLRFSYPASAAFTNRDVRYIPMIVAQYE
jgi:uncharacterized protein (TIGR02598 family)